MIDVATLLIDSGDKDDEGSGAAVHVYAPAERVE